MQYSATINDFRILLADDDIDDCMLFNDALDELDLATQFEYVQNGELLMQRIHSLTIPLPDMLFLDLNMPRKNGVECLIEIKQNSQFKHLPVVIYSTSQQPDIVNQLYLNGATLFMRKPNDFLSLKNLIFNAINITKEARATQLPRERFVLTETLPV